MSFTSSIGWFVISCTVLIILLKIFVLLVISRSIF